MLGYLVKHQTARGSNSLELYPDEYSHVVDGVITWYETVMKICSTKLIKMIIGPKALNQKPFPQEEVSRCTDEFFNLIVPVLNKRL